MKNLWKKYWLLIIGFLVGALGGWLYWRFVGCLGGSCPIWSNMYIATGYGGIFGFLLAGLVPGKKKKPAASSAPEDSLSETDTKATS